MKQWLHVAEIPLLDVKCKQVSLLRATLKEIYSDRGTHFDGANRESQQGVPQRHLAYAFWSRSK